ncbi:GNAT family N-acetyltransferase [Psychroserpens algicola]|uniref:GNAT family N-acetyltransferase n=1 Tax=Psychroserpens algicola TaxID=1719034 RepID=UPI001F3CA17F|nr:GNAT family protein [Psychroserpens algicola]
MITFDHFNINLLQAHEGEAFHDLINLNRVRLEDFFAGTVAKTLTLDDTLKYCEEIQERIKAKSYFPYVITDTKTNTFVGLVDVKNIDWNVPKAELGYFIDTNYSGRGITSKAVSMVIEALIEIYQFKKLLCRVGSKNLGSINVALKNKFELEGTIRNDYRTTKGEIVDLNYYGRIF